MRDDETDSLWSHILGKCMDGKLKGTELEKIPSQLTDWKSWKEQHPETTAIIMSKTAGVFNRKIYRDAKQFVVGIARGKESRAWRFDHLKEQPLVNDTWREKPVVVYLALPSHSATIFSRTLGDQVLTFQKKGEVITDRETGSQWNLQAGVAIDGPLKGKHLRQLRSIPSFTRAWKQFHPESTYWDPAADNARSGNQPSGKSGDKQPESASTDGGNSASKGLFSTTGLTVAFIAIPALIGFVIVYRMTVNG